MKFSTVTGTASDAAADSCELLVVGVLQAAISDSKRLDIRQLPSLVEQGFLGTVEAKEHFELPARVRRHPVRVLPCGNRGTELHVHRTIGVLLQPWRVGATTGPPLVANQGMSRAVV